MSRRPRREGQRLLNGSPASRGWVHQRTCNTGQCPFIDVVRGTCFWVSSLETASPVTPARCPQPCHSRSPVLDQTQSRRQAPRRARMAAAPTRRSTASRAHGPRVCCPKKPDWGVGHVLADDGGARVIVCFLRGGSRTVGLCSSRHVHFAGSHDARCAPEGRHPELVIVVERINRCAMALPSYPGG